MIVEYLMLIGLIVLAFWAMWYVVAYKTAFPTLMAGTTGYEWSAVWTTRFSGKFTSKRGGYKFKHNDLMFVRPTNSVFAFWKQGDWLICNPVDDHDFEPGAFYLFEQNHQYRIVKCEANQSGLPPVFDGSETLITHKCVGRIFAIMEDRRTMKMLKIIH